MFDSITTEEYKIDVNKDKTSVFTVYSIKDDIIIEQVQSIRELVNEKYLPSSRRSEIEDITNNIFVEELKQLKDFHYSFGEDEKRFFNKYFEGINLVYKIGKTFSKEIQKKIIDEITELTGKTFEGERIPTYMEDNKVNVIFKVNPLDYLKEFDRLYEKIISDGNYSIIFRALEFATIVDKVHKSANDIMSIVDKYK